MGMQRVLHIIDHAGLGGAQRVVAGIMAQRPDDRIFVLRDKGFSFFKSLAANYLFPVPRSFLQLLTNTLRLPKKIRENNIRIIHCHLTVSWLWGLWLSWVLPERYAVRILFHEHNSDKLKKWYYKHLLRQVARTGKIIAVSKYVESRLKECKVLPSQIVLLKNFVDQSFLSPDAQKQNKLDIEQNWIEGHKLIGFAGRLNDVKGAGYIIEAAKALSEERVKFLIAGDGPQKKEIQEQIKLFQLEDKVVLLGVVEDMSKFYNSIDLLIAPSIEESFGLVMLEAQASGVLVVAFEIEIANEIISRDNAMLSPKGDLEGLVKNIRLAIKDQERVETFVANGIENAKRFSVSEYLPRLEETYKQILQDKQ
jgi:glycosyltransferase involved in cell wall biosynthesis